MEELLTSLDAEIASALEAVASLREQLSRAESKLANLQAGKAALLGQPLPDSHKPHGKTLAGGRRPGSGRPVGSKLRDAIAASLEKGPKRASEIARELNVDSSVVSRTLRSTRGIRDLGWFVQVGGEKSPYTLTEAGRNRHKTPPA